MMLFGLPIVSERETVLAFSLLYTIIYDAKDCITNYPLQLVIRTTVFNKYLSLWSVDTSRLAQCADTGPCYSIRTPFMDFSVLGGLCQAARKSKRSSGEKEEDLNM